MKSKNCQPVGEIGRCLKKILSVYYGLEKEKRHSLSLRLTLYNTWLVMRYFLFYFGSNVGSILKGLISMKKTSKQPNQSTFGSDISTTKQILYQSSNSACYVKDFCMGHLNFFSNPISAKQRLIRNVWLDNLYCSSFILV